MGSAAGRNPAPAPIVGQSERVSDGGSRLGRAAGPRLAGQSGLLSCRWFDLGTWLSSRLQPGNGPLPSGRHHGRFSQVVDPTQDGRRGTVLLWRVKLPVDLLWRHRAVPVGSWFSPRSA